MLSLGLTIGWILTIFIGALGVIILWKIVTGSIDLTRLIADERGWASLSRFQFLIFTFVIGMSLFFIIASKPEPDYPDIPNQILALLGISGGSYVVAKGIQTSYDVGMTAEGNPPPEAPIEGTTEIKKTAAVIEKESVTTGGEDV